LNPRNPRDQKKLMSILDEQTNLLKSLGGTISGEHGDGQLRTRSLKHLVGPLWEVFWQVKNLFDPQNILNPGKILNANEDAPFENWRYAAFQLNAANDDQQKPSATYLNLLDQCHGCGLCRSYCPEFKKEADEIKTGRAKALVIQGWLSGRLTLQAQWLREFLSQCTNCGICQAQCGTHVDITLLCQETCLRLVPKLDRLSPMQPEPVHLEPDTVDTDC